MTRPFKFHSDIFQHMSRMGSHDDYAVREKECLVNAVGDEDDGLPVQLPDAEKFFLEQHSRVRVERAEGFVHKKHFWIVCEGPRDRRTLTHTAGEFVWLSVGEFSKPTRAR